MPVPPLSPEKLRYVCDPDQFDFETTADLDGDDRSIIGQPRGVRAIEFGIGIRSQGYNIFVLGETGTGRTTTIQRFLKEQTARQPTPFDWIYVNNFAAPHRPWAISLPPGEGAAFRARMRELIAGLQKGLPQAFAAESYRQAVDALQSRAEGQQDARLRPFREEAAHRGFALLRTASGPVIAPVQDGKVMPPASFAALPLAEQRRLEEVQATLEDQFEAVLEALRQIDRERQQEMDALNRRVAQAAVAHDFDALAADYPDHEAIGRYLAEVRADVLDRLGDFVADGETAVPDEEIDWRRYAVNLFVDRREMDGAPVIVDDNPTYHNLIGAVEHEVRHGVLSAHFTTLKAGSLHRANGGYLVLEADDVLSHGEAWEALKRALKSRQLTLQPPERAGNQPTTTSLEPEPIPLSVKVILIGLPRVYYYLYDVDEAFAELFKVKADFDSEMGRDGTHEQAYARFVAGLCHEEGLHHFDQTAVAKVVEFGAWLSEHQSRLSTRFSEVADLVREASYWAEGNGRSTVAADDVQQAIDERTGRSNRLQERLQEEISEGTLFIDVEGVMVGQVNGLSIIEVGDYAFGQPGRITARTFMGESGVVNIEREVDLSGPIHNKGLLTLNGYLGGQYATRQPLSLSASLTFEQNYSGVEGDSAASAELYALLSSLSEIPLRQGIAVTGSVNQRGEVQPIGGVSEKVEGYFAVCRALGLTGDQGVLIPAANARHLMLHEEVVTAVGEGQFHIWSVETIDEGIEILTGKPAGERDEDGRFPEGTVHHAVQARLLELAQSLKSFGDDEDADE